MQNNTNIKKNLLFRFVTFYSVVSILLQSFLPILYLAPRLALAQEITPTETITPTAEPTISPTVSPTVAPTVEPTIAPTSEPTILPTITPTPSDAITPTQGAQVTPEVTPTTTPTPEKGEILDGIATKSATFSEVKIPQRKTENLVKSAKSQSQREYVEGEVIVKFKNNKLDVKSIFGKAQAFVFEKKFSLAKADEIKDANIQVFKSKKSTKALVDELKKDGDVEYAQPNYIYKPSTISTDDTYKNLLWGLDNTGQSVNGVAGTSDADIDAPEAWGISEGSNVIVAVIDSGVAYNHSDLASNMWDGSSCKDYTGAMIVGGCNHGYDFEDIDNTPLPTTSMHGTHVAGVIAAIKNNSNGIIGVSPKAKIMALKMDGSTAQVVKAIAFAQQNGAKIINFSWIAYSTLPGGYYDTALYSAIRDYQGLFVNAAGNSSYNHEDGVDIHKQFPAGFKVATPIGPGLNNIIVVAATNQNDTLASFSDYGLTTVDVGAPGTNIYTTESLSEDFSNALLPGFTNTIFTKSSGNWKTSTWGDFGGSIADKNVEANSSYINNDSGLLTLTIPANISVVGNDVLLRMTILMSTEPPVTGGCYDYFTIETDNNDGNWTQKVLTCGDLNDRYEINLGPASSTNMRVRFGWVTDVSDVGTIVPVLDDIEFTNTNSYQFADGTSFAAPHVAGLAALIWGYKPSLTISDVKTNILSTGDTLPTLSGKTVTGKRINAFAALNGLNNSPTTSAVAATTSEDTLKTITLSGSDIDGDALTYSIVSGPTHGTLGVISGNQVNYTPTLNYNGTDTFTYKANDGHTDSNISTVTISISAVNDAPTATSSSVSITEDIASSITLQGVDVDGNSLTYSIVTAPTHGTLGAISGNTVTYTPALNYNGSDSFTFKTNDGTVDSNIATVTVTVNAANDPPVLDPIGNKTVNELSTLTFTAHAVDPDSSVTYSLTGAPIGATINSTSGVFSFTPTEAQDGAYTVTVNATDGTLTDSEVITITVKEVNVAPVASDVTDSTNEDTAKAITLSATDSDIPANTLTYIKVTNPLHGTVTISGNQATYTPTANYVGADSFTYKANDTVVDSNIAAVNITVYAINDAPIISTSAPTSATEDTLYTYDANVSDIDGPGATWSKTLSDTCGGTINSSTGIYIFTPVGPVPPASCVLGIKVEDGGTPNLAATQTTTISIAATNDVPVSATDSYTTVEDTTLNITAPGILANDSDPEGSSLTSILLSGASHGTLTLNSNGSFSYVPNSNYNGSDSFTYKANDGQSDSNATTVTITVNATNDAPVAGANSYTTNEDTILTIDYSSLLANDSDPDGDTISISGVSNSVHGGVVNSPLENKIIFTPDANYSGTASFDYTITDGNLTSTATVTLTFNSVNDAPVLATIGNKNIDEFATLTTVVSATDIDDTNLTYTTSALPANATFNASTRTFSFTPNESQGGNTYNVTFTVSDGSLTDSETIAIQVNEVNNSPVAVNDNASVNEDAVLTTSTATLLTNDYDLDTNTNAGLTITAVNSPINGTVSLSGSTITFTPYSNFNGTAFFTYLVSDGSLTTTGTVSITVNAVNDAPVLDAIGSKSIDEFSTISIIANATDVDNGTLTYTTSALPANATFNAATRTFTFTPVESQGGSTYNITFTVSDGVLTDSETVAITVNEVNSAPVAVNDNASVNEDSTLTLNTSTLLANDYDLDTNTNVGLTISAVNTAVNGIVSLSGSTITFVPVTNFNGTASFKYVVTDGSLTATGTVSVTVSAVNDAPVVTAGVAATNEDVLKSITLSGSDIDGDALTYSIVSGPTHGTLGTVIGNTVTYTPTLNYNGSDSFTFKANDGTVDSNTATVTITVNAVNDAPVLSSIGDKTIDELTNLTFTAVATDPDSSVTYSLTGAPTGATINSTSGVFNFTPSETQGPGTYTLTVNATDGTLTDSETISVTVKEVNTSPVADTVSTSTNEDIAKNITLTATDSDIPANILTYSKVSNPSHGMVTISGNQATYTPAANYFGPDSFTYKASDSAADSNIATVTITVNAVNDAPVAVADSSTTNEDTILSISKTSLLTNDTDADGDSLTLLSVSNPIHGTVAINGANIEFTPDTDYSGTAGFNYTITDGALTGTATVTIAVNAVNDAPVAHAGSVTTNEDNSIEITLSGTDVDGDNLTYSVASSVSNGTLGAISGNKISYTPSTNYNGTDSFTFKANDGLLDSNTATVTIAVNAVNDAPVLSTIGNKTVNELATLTFTATATDPDSTVAYSLTGAPTGATINSTSGVFSFTPTEVQGPGIYTVAVNATDGTLIDTESIVITVSEINIAPTAQDTAVSTVEDGTKIITLSATDSDLPANTLSFIKVTNPTHGSVSIVGDKATYIPSADYNGADSFTFKTNDGTTDSNTATVSITVTPVNDAPVPLSNSYTTNEDTVLTIDYSSLLANDSDVDGDTITVSGVSSPVHGTVVNSPTENKVIFTPDIDYVGNAGFSYTVTDGALTATTTVTITLNPVNDAPVANDSAVSVAENTGMEIVLNSTDVDGDTLAYSIVSEPINGTLGVISGNKVIYTPSTGYLGSDSFTFKTNDGTLDSNTAIVNITVSPLVISNVGYSALGTNSVTITWTTNHISTSRVLYDTVAPIELGAAPNYGYIYSTNETNSNPKVIQHSVTINGLTPSTTYHYRVVSKGSPELVSNENTFTTATESNNNSNNGGSSNGGSNSSNSQVPQCNDQKPGSAPVLISAVSGYNSVTLTWSKASDPVSYYLVTYGTSSGSQTYGNPNVGNSSTTSYTITGLSGDTRYYFKVRAGNGCAPGDYSNELSATPNGGFLAGVAPGFGEGVLGENTSVTSENNKTISQSEIENNVLGKGTEADKKADFNYTIPLLLLVLISGIIIVYLRRKRKEQE